ncbi:S9 family peptidase [Algoriphagus sediminis]|uniref:S9 family peptidase n=1 Tax=Algoriphagus sediminis TaxID=3057113 RepID=A0ABT7YAY2_9BACT|nr:S9 family peptidase [Algoriphagus sediminis]MDN3203673.1 S9 family peptidase [Algoriphagus sediminis]
MKKLLLSTILILTFGLINAQESALSVEYIMRDPAWIGTFPSSPYWSKDGQTIYFRYNLENDPADSLYKISLANPEKIKKVDWKEAQNSRATRGELNMSKTSILYSEGQKIMEEDVKTGESKVIFEWYTNLNNPSYLADESLISFNSEDNIFVFDTEKEKVTKVTNIKDGKAPSQSSGSSNTEKEKGYLEQETVKLSKVLQEREEKDKMRRAYREATQEEKEEEPFAFYKQGKNLTNLRLSPNQRFATFSEYNRNSNKPTGVPDYMDASGYTKELRGRPKVGTEGTTVEIGFYDLENDTVFYLNKSILDGIKDLPDYVADYPDKEWEEEERKVFLAGPYFSPSGETAIVVARSLDNKDRWIASVDFETGDLITLDRQRDEAWIAGPGIGWTYSSGVFGWLPDSEHIYFQSEESGYSHLYLLNVNTGKKTALTSGDFEVFDPFISKDGEHWYFTSSEVSPSERHFYKMPLMGGEKEQLTFLEGKNDAFLSPEEDKLLVLNSFSNRPEELFLKDLSKRNAEAKQLTFGQSEEFQAYEWREPEIIRFEAEDGAMVPARLYTPEDSKKNGAAVIFVHGAGYLQNVHKWWSSYFREYMFHNLLTDLGYTVLDIDYRSSAGYGRDWRTGIYRHMGGKDLSDQIDGAKYLIDFQDIDPERLGIYGGSYGGFITLMALFTEPDVFKSGAALRSVTDWAHYNHGYTSNILNTPEEDPIAYERSSPIYFAEGLKGNLLIAHGMVDVNVQFQDVVRLAQRLIELEKDNWEMAVYPVEDHGFVEPSSWTDEYKRILKLFNTTLLD